MGSADFLTDRTTSQTFGFAWVWPDRAPSGHHWLGGPKKPLRGRHFADTDKLEAAGHGVSARQVVQARLGCRLNILAQLIAAL